MKYSITLQNLPYEPEKRQVVFVESKYDERINTIIRDNYDRIKSIFKDADMQNLSVSYQNLNLYFK